MDALQKQVLDSWDMHQRINNYFLNHLPESVLGESMGEGERNIGDLFAHMHHVRRMWLQLAMPSLWEDTEPMTRKQYLFKHHLKEHLNHSALAIRALLENGLKENKIKGFKTGPLSFLTYLMTHEAHHRGQVLLILRANGHELPDELVYGIWDWGKR